MLQQEVPDRCSPVYICRHADVTEKFDVECSKDKSFLQSEGQKVSRFADEAVEIFLASVGHDLRHHMAPENINAG